MKINRLINASGMFDSLASYAKSNGWKDLNFGKALNISPIIDSDRDAKFTTLDRDFYIVLDRDLEDPNKAVMYYLAPKTNLGQFEELKFIDSEIRGKSLVDAYTLISI